jgi:hypothetical protein
MNVSINLTNKSEIAQKTECTKPTSITIQKSTIFSNDEEGKFSNRLKRGWIY